MALADLSFKLYEDSDLTTEFSGVFNLTHQSDLSDNPQDFQLWLGSTVSGRQLQTTVNPGTDQITLTPTFILGEWAASTAYSVGDRREPTTPNGFIYEVTVAGTSGSSEPTWPTSGIGSTVTDGTVTWKLVAQKHATTEIKLALTAAGLAGATAGAALNLGTTIDSGVANAVEINVRFTNAVTAVSDNEGNEELAPLYINDVTESA